MSSKIDPRLFRAAALSLAVLGAGPASAKGFSLSFLKGKAKAPVQLHSRAYSVPKAGEEAAKNQDSHAADAVKGRFAVGDGVSASAHPRQWSDALTEGFVKGGPEGGLVEWLSPLRGLWKQKVDAKLNANVKPREHHQEEVAAVHQAPAPQVARPSVSIFEDFASEFKGGAAQHTAAVQQAQSPGDELLAELAGNPGRVKKTAPKPVASPASHDTNIGDELVAYLGVEKTQEKGASSTLVGLEVDTRSTAPKVPWQATALKDNARQKFSDSVVFQVRQRKGVVGWVAANVLRKGKIKTVDQFPPVAAADMDNKPAQLRTKTDADGEIELATKQGLAKRGDKFVITTDAVGKWILDAKGRQRSQRLQRLLDTKDQAGFAKLVDEEREKGMGNDDSTLMVVDVK